MPVTGFYWNDSALKAKIAAAYRASLVEASAFARSRAPWRHVAASISPAPNGVHVGASDAVLAEKGARPHVIAPENEPVLSAGKGSGFVVGGAVKHPGFRGQPFMRPTAEAWPSMFTATAKRTLPRK